MLIGKTTSLLILLSFVVTFGYRKSATLTPVNSSVDGAAVTLLHDTVISANSDAWEINCTDNSRYWAMEISLDRSWGFHPSLPSNITLRVNSDTPTETSTDLDFILSFSVNRARYWSTMLNADARTDWDYNHTIGPQCDTNEPPLSASLLYAGDVKARIDSSSNDRAGVSGAMPGDDWQPVNNVIYFPFEFKVGNRPADNEMYVYNIQETYTQKCGFAETFETAQGLQMYFHLDDPGEFLAVQSFEVEYEDDTTANPTTTDPATAHPSTRNPTTPNPTTADPTSNPTIWPTTGNPSTATTTTNNPTTSDPTTAAPSSNTTDNPFSFITTTTTDPTTAQPSTRNPTTPNPTTADPTTSNPTTPNPSTADPTSTTGNPSTAHPSTNNPTANNPTTSDPSTAPPSKNPTDNPLITTTTTASSSPDRQTETTTTDMAVDNPASETTVGWAAQNINLLLSIFGAVFVCMLCVICIMCYNNAKASSESRKHRKVEENELAELSQENKKIANDVQDDAKRDNDSVELQLEGGAARADARAVAESVIDPNRNYKPEGDRASFITVITPMAEPVQIEDDDNSASDPDDELMYNDNLKIQDNGAATTM